MFEKFEGRFAKDNVLPVKMDIDASLGNNFPSELRDFFLRYAGTTFCGGLYRVISHPLMRLSNEFIVEAFPDFNGKAICFSYDWLGRLFALDLNRQESGDFGVLMFEPGTGKVLEIPANLYSFHDEELINYANEALATEFYEQWLESGGRAPSVDQCIGYKKPLFLGGEDTVQNLVLSDLKVYWSVSVQLICKTRKLSVGTKINSVILK